VDALPPSPPQIGTSIRRYWTERAAARGRLEASRELVRALWEFALDSLPARRRSRFGDADYDWDYRVNTTGGAVGWKDRLLGVFHSPYQPTEPQLFREMLGALAQRTGLDFADFTFIDLGSGKGRTLLMASDFPFCRIVGVELLPALDRVAQQNLADYRGEFQKCFTLESLCGDATRFLYPDGPLVIYLFNPLPQPGLRQALANLGETLARHPRAAFVLYHNPQHESTLLASGFLRKIAGTHQYSIFAAEM
jgi:hypothetical protein